MTENFNDSKLVVHIQLILKLVVAGRHIHDIVTVQNEMLAI